MSLFRRRRRDAEPDETFPYLSADAAARIRSLVREAFAEQGIEVVVHADHVTGADGLTFGLGNVAAACHGEERGERAWPGVVREHVRIIAGAVTAASPLDTRSREEVLADLHVRVLAAEGLPPEFAAYAREVAPGLAEVLALDLPDSVAYLGAAHVARFGPLDELRAAALANTGRVRADRHEVLRRDGGSFDVLLGDSVYLASTVVLLPEVLEREGLVPDPTLGVFVAVPFRHQLAVHVVRDASAVPSLQLLAQFAATGCTEGVGPIVPDVYWWRAGEWERVTEVGDHGIRIHVGPELGDVLDRLTAG